MPAQPPLTTTVPAALVSRAAAAALIDAALAAARELGVEASVAVADATGALRAFERTDGAPFLTAEIAIDKAWTAASSGRTGTLWNAIVQVPAAAPLAKVSRLLAVAGGSPLLADGQLVGGIGVSGGSAEQDEQVAHRALQVVGFPLSPTT